MPVVSNVRSEMRTEKRIRQLNVFASMRLITVYFGQFATKLDARIDQQATAKRHGPSHALRRIKFLALKLLQPRDQHLRDPSEIRRQIDVAEEGAITGQVRVIQARDAATTIFGELFERSQSNYFSSFKCVTCNTILTRY